MQKLTFKLIGMDCTSCAFNIDGALEDLEGVKEAITNYAKQFTVVTYDPTVISIPQMIAAVKNIDNTYEIEIIP